MKASTLAGRLVAVADVVGSGKTVLLRRIQDELTREGRVTVSKSLSVDKDRTTIPTLGEKRERELPQLVRRGRKPVALFVDEAHDLHGKTLISLKRLMEVVADGGGMLSVVLVGHPKLRNDLRRPTMEEIGYRSVVFEFDGMAGNQLAYIRWLLERCVGEGVDLGDLIDTAAVELLASRLKTPLQIEQHLSLAFEEAFRVGERPVTVQVVESVLSRHLDDLEPRLTRHGYSVRSLADQFSTSSSGANWAEQGRRS
ncbi:MAG TPA: AAA family ATPase [Azospirillum sp.]